MTFFAKKDFGTACAFILFISVIVGFGIFAVLSEIKKDEIIDAVPTSNRWLMVGGSHARFALSADAIMIKYRNIRFLQSLAEGSPDLEQSEDGSVRSRSTAVG